MYSPCGVWVVWSVTGPWKPPSASTQSCPPAVGRLTQEHCPESKSQLTGGLQAPLVTEISSNLTADAARDSWAAWNATWWTTQTVFQGAPDQYAVKLHTVRDTHEFGERYGSLFSNKERLTWNCAGEDTVTSATCQPKEGAPDRLQSASPRSPLRITCTLRMLEGPSESQYLRISKLTANSPSDNSERKGCMWWQRYTHQKRTHSCVSDDNRGVSSWAVCVASVVM